ncbi:MAG: MHYT domain-containing protein, partial [Janthinobacterium lividum]
MITASYDLRLVALSVAIAALAAYTALELGERAGSAAPRSRRLWVAAAAAAMGGGIWSMHFVGMLAFRSPVPVTYDIGLTLLSLAVAVAATSAAFFWISRNRTRRTDLLLGGLFMGGAIAGMHYIGMSAMRMQMTTEFAPVRVLLSVIIAVVAATAALALAFRHQRMAMRLLAALVMGLAVAGMHYTGMWAAHFGLHPMNPAAAMPQPLMAEQPGGAAIGAMGADSVVLWVLAVTFMILFLALLASTIVQQRSQRLLRISEARFRVAAEAVGDIIWTNTPEGRMMGAQPDWSRFTGQPQAEYEGFGWARAIHPDDVDATVADWQGAVDGRRVFETEHRVRRADGVWRLCSVRAVPVFNDAGALQEWVGVHEDITERRDIELELRTARDRAEAASQVKSQFIANMSHELRTPLAAIIGYSETMEEELEDGASAEELLSDLRKVQSNARHLLGLINDILDLSTVEAGRMEVFAEDLDLDA